MKSQSKRKTQRKTFKCWVLVQLISASTTSQWLFVTWKRVFVFSFCNSAAIFCATSRFITRSCHAKKVKKVHSIPAGSQCYKVKLNNFIIQGLKNLHNQSTWKMFLKFIWNLYMISWGNWRWHGEPQFLMIVPLGAETNADLYQHLWLTNVYLLLLFFAFISREYIVKHLSITASEK